MLLFAGLLTACGGVSARSPADSAVTSEPLGTEANPARTCAELDVAGMPSGVYWLHQTALQDAAFRVYCEQDFNGGGWAMLENSVRRDDGSTTTFWQFKYDDRLREFGTLAPDQNYYNGALYKIGTEYMDVFTDLADKTVGAAVMTAKGFNPTTMQFMQPALTIGSADVFGGQFASGWSSQDHDGDPYADGTANCAKAYANIAQHYSACWIYNLGADADADVFDGGVGPHVNNTLLTTLGLMLQPGGGSYSQVKRIARFVRW